MSDVRRSWKIGGVSVAAILVVTTLLVIGVARADFATPFVEIQNKVGDISEGHGYVVATSNDKEPAGFLVIVLTDTMEHVVIRAKADPGTVKPSLLGRPVIVKAKITKRVEASGSKPPRVELKILNVRKP